MSKELITHSRRVAFRACPRRHHYSYNLGIRKIGRSQPLESGQAWHDYMDGWWNGDLSVMPFSVIGDQYERARLVAMAVAYDERWASHRPYYGVREVEVEFRADLRNPETAGTSPIYERGGKIDKIVDYDDGSWVVEHKTSSEDLSLGSTYWRKRRLDPQIGDYMIGATALGYVPRGIIYDVAKKPPISPLEATPEEKREMTLGKGCKNCGGSAGGKGGIVRGLGQLQLKSTYGDVVESVDCGVCEGTGYIEQPRWKAHVRLEAETPEEYGQRCLEYLRANIELCFQREKVVRLDAEMIEHATNDWYTVQSMHAVKKAGHHPRNPDSCFLYNRQCDYWDVCTGGASIDDGSIFEHVGAHPELAKPAHFHLPIVTNVDDSKPF